MLAAGYFHPIVSPGALRHKQTADCILLPGPLYSAEGFVVAVAGGGAGGEARPGLRSPRPCRGKGQQRCLHECAVVVVVLTSVLTSRCSKRGFLRTSCPRFEDLQHRSCLQRVNLSKCKCIRFLPNLGIVFYRALGRGKELDHVLN